jgi:RNA polymerase sigma-70 factor, ECF subfamily
MSAGKNLGFLAFVLRGRNTPQIATKRPLENNRRIGTYSYQNMSTISAEHLLAEHGAALQNFLGARCRDTELTAELMQEVASRLVLASPRLRLNGNARGYLFRIAASVWHDHLRRELVRRRATALVQRDEPALAPAADARLLERELRDAVRRAVKSLPAVQRDVVELRQHGDLTFQQIAERLGRPLGTVLTQMRAALTRIYAQLESYR